jgi:hypothetical protein
MAAIVRSEGSGICTALLSSAAVTGFDSVPGATGGTAAGAGVSPDLVIGVFPMGLEAIPRDM